MGWEYRRRNQLWQKGMVGCLWDVTGDEQLAAGRGALALRREGWARGGDLGIISTEVSVKSLHEIWREARVRGGIL